MSKFKKRLREWIVIIGAMLLILSASLAFFSIKYYLALPSEKSFADEGIYTFSPYQVLPGRIKNTQTGRYQRMNPYVTVYNVHYKAKDGYRYTVRVSGKSTGQKIVRENVPLQRRVLINTDNNTYITVEAEESAESYISKMKGKYIVILALSAVYIIFYIVIWYVVLMRKRENTL